jgi:hypothetical protein
MADRRQRSRKDLNYNPKAAGVGGYSIPLPNSGLAFAAALDTLTLWLKREIRGHEQGIHPHRRRA